MDKARINQLQGQFDDILCQVKDDSGNHIEFWYARDLQNRLGYVRWEGFASAVDRAKEACITMSISVDDHFRDVTKMIEIGKGGMRAVQDVMLTRFACYLIAQNGDPRKEEIAFAQTYFALQTRKQELIEEHLNNLTRIETRDRLRASEKQLSQNIFERGVGHDGFGRIRSKGDAALFGGHTTEQMKERLGINDTHRPLADFLPTLTIAAKNLAVEMTNFNVEEKNMCGERPITTEHIQNNRSVRSMLNERGIIPENLPASEDIKKIERKVKAAEKRLAKGAGRLPSNK